MKKTLLLMAGFAAAMSMQGQQLKEGYLTWPSSSDLPTYISAWNGGQGKMTIEGKEWEDENFFVSRIKPRERFYNLGSQVYESITQYSAENPNGNDKRVLYWVPIGDEVRGTFRINALPDGNFDGDVFSMWSYLDHYGNWTSPYGWLPGNFADVAHKNGVAVSGVASVPYGGITATWSACMRAMCGLTAEQVGKFLYYHGVDGLGYNSEWSGFSPKSNGLTDLHNGLMTYMATRNPLFENIWYGGTNDNGSIQFDTGVGSTGNNTEIFKGSSIFLNYNYSNASYANSSIQHAKNVGKNPFYIYAGNNMQGSEPSNNFSFLKNYQYSIGLWGAHSTSMFWAQRSSKGSATAVKQRTYLNQNEQWFGNGPRNPAIKKPIASVKGFAPDDEFGGFSSMMSARSVLKWDITSKDPFYTYFNLGNGSFFNFKGERMNNNNWYNIGIQDYLPTWRYWFAPKFMQKDVAASEVSLYADFTWEDAYFGGSSLQIGGSAKEEYLHLFKTGFYVDYDQVITVRYKLIDGEADVDLVLSTFNNPTSAIEILPIFTVAQSEDIADATYNDGWQTATFVIGEDLFPEDIQDEGGIGVIALRFKNASNLNMLLGEMSIMDMYDSATPAKPQITVSRVLANNYAGVDAKLIWNMANSKAAGEPVYNADVNTSMFRMWAQQEGGEPIMMGMTTSWAGFIFSAPNDSNKAQRMRFGVSALSADMRSESEISWSSYLDLGAYEAVDNVEVNKSVIKPNEDFELSFSDPNHEAATWILRNSDSGQEVWRGNGATVTCPGLAEVGAYDLVVELAATGRADNTVEFPRYISITSEAVGALPEIYSMSIGDSEVNDTDQPVSITINESKTFSYTGRKADGASSRGVELQEGLVGVCASDFGENLNNKSFSVACWLKITSLPEGKSNFFTIEDREEGWPNNVWGQFWSRISGEGKFNYRFIEGDYTLNLTGGMSGNRLMYLFNNTKIDVNAWTHVALVYDYNSSGQVRMAFFVNGKRQFITAWANIGKEAAISVLDGLESGGGGDYGAWDRIDYLAQSSRATAGGVNVEQAEYSSNSGGSVTNNDWLAFGGNATARDITAIDGVIDDFQVWGKAMTEEDVALSMAGLDGNNLPEDVLAYWDFEEDATELAPGSTDVVNGFVAKHSSKLASAPVAYTYNFETVKNESDVRNHTSPVFTTGCPFISGTAYPIVTKPTWNTRRAVVEGDGTGESGSANIAWTKAGDYTVELQLANGHGTAAKEYPVIKVGNSAAIDGIVADEASSVNTYTVEDMLFVEFDQDGYYTIDVYNMSGMLVGQKQANIVAGQNAQIGLGAAGVYLVKITCNGQELRTVKVISK